MGLRELQLLDNHRNVINRFVAACQADDRIVAAFLGGSYAAGKADKYSDIDLYLITSDDGFDEIISERKQFIRLLGEPLFLEDFGMPHTLFFMFSDQTEGELWFGHASAFHHLHEGAFNTLLDKPDILSKAIFPQREADLVRQKATLRRQVAWFWHELSHFIKAMGRGQLWFAYGQIEVMRQICVILARLDNNFSDPYIGDEPYFKLENALDVELLSPLQTTFCPMEYAAMLEAAFVLVDFYRNVAPKLAKMHDIQYQPDLERIMLGQLEDLLAV